MRGLRDWGGPERQGHGPSLRGKKEGVRTGEELLPGLEEGEARGGLYPEALPPEERADGVLGRAVGEVDAEDGADGGGFALPVFE